MHINVSGHHVEVTEAIREAVDTRLSKVASHFPNLENVDVTLTVEPHEQHVEANTQYFGEAVAVHASDTDMYAAISQASKKLHSALEHRKGIIKSMKKAAS